MHGVRRDEYEDTLEARRKDEAEQLVKWNEALLALTQLDTLSTFDAVLKGTADVLLMNPDYYQAWNIRKRAIVAGMSSLNLKDELGFNVETIKANPKSYHGWYHRRWLLALSFPKGTPFDPAHELHLCQLLLDLDKRNFHCWNYRKWLCDHFDLAPLEEFDYCGRKIFQNFSNYSAWHRRSQLAPKAFPDPTELLALIEKDLKLVRNAYYTEPADQSAWFYLKWLSQTVMREFPERKDLLLTELDSIQQLLAMEPDAPLALLAVLNIKTVLGEAAPADVIEKLKTVDPQRAGLYSSMY